MTNVVASLMTATALNELRVREIWAKAGSRQHHEALTRLGVTRIIQPERDAGLAMATEIRIPHDLATPSVNCRPTLPLGSAGTAHAMRH